MNSLNLIVFLLGFTLNAYCGQPELMLWPHQGTQYTAVSMDGNTLALGGFVGNIRLFTFHGAAVSMQSINTGNRSATALALSPDGSLLAASGDDGWVALFETGSARKTADVTPGKGKPSKLMYSEDGKMLAVAYGSEVVLLDAVAGKRLGAFHIRGTPALALAKSRSWMKYASSKSEIRSFSAEQEKKLGHYVDMRLLWASPGGKLTAFGFAPEVMRNSDGKPISLPGLPGQYAQHVAFSGDGGRMAVLREYGDVQAWDLKKGRLTAAFNWRENNSMMDMDEARFKLADGLHFVNGGRQLCIISQAGPVELWDADTGKKVKTLSPNTASVGTLALIPGKRQLLSADWTGRVILWDFEKGDVLRQWPPVTHWWPASVAVSSDGQSLYYGDSFVTWGALRRMDGSGSPIEFGGRRDRQMKKKESNFHVLHNPFKPGETLLISAESAKGLGMAAALKSAKKLEDAGGSDKFGLDRSPDDKMMVYGTKDGGIGVVNLETGDIRKVGGGGNYVWAVSYSTDGKYLAMADIAGAVTVWETAGWKKYAVLAGFKSDIGARAPLSPDGHYAIQPDLPEKSKALLAKGIGPNMRDTRRFKIIDMRTKKESVVDESGETRLAFSSDSSEVMGLREEGSVKVWETATGKTLAELKAPAAKQFSAELLPGGKYLFAGGGDGVIRLYELASGKQIVSLTGFLDGEWLFTLPNGKYKGSKGAIKYFKFKGSGKRSSLDKYESSADIEAALSAI